MKSLGRVGGRGVAALWTALWTALCGCGSPSPVESPTATQGERVHGGSPSTRMGDPHTTEQPRVSAGDAAQSTSLGPTPAESDEPRRATAPALLPEGVFPPPDVVPPFERTAAEGDGLWRPFSATRVRETGGKNCIPEEEKGCADLPRQGAGKGPAVLTTRLHPHPTSRWQSLTIAALDLRRLRLAHELGTSDVKETKHAGLADDVGLVPVDRQPELVAVFNGGFQPRHGWWGIISHGVELVEPREGGCALAIFSEPDAPEETFRPVALAPWSRLQGERERMVSIRQTPPCLIVDGEIDPRLAGGNERPWGGQQKDRKTRRRSAVALSEDGRTLFYVLGEEVGPRRLAVGLKAVGVRAAAQLDINWNWTRFWLFDQREGADAEPQSSPSIQENGADSSTILPVGSGASLVDQMAKDRGEYLTRRSRRDFFYVTRRPKVGRHSPPSGR